MVFNYSLHPEADATKHAPFKKTLKDAGFDVPAFLPDGPVCIPAKGSIVIPTAIKTYFPATHVALVRSRSGLSVKHDIEIGAGVIDSGFEATIRIKLYNHGDTGFVVEDGMRIAQILFVQIYCGPLPELQEETYVRGEKGFGSSGLFN